MMQNIKNKFFKQVIDGFQNNKGKASIYCFEKSIIPELVYNIITPFSKKHLNEKIFIVVDKYETRRIIKNFLDNKNINEENGYNIKILSSSYIKLNYSYCYKLIITIGVNNELDIIKHLNYNSTFMFTILTENIMNNDFITSVRNILPSINTINIDNYIKSDLIYSPVEEHRYGVDISDNDRLLYNKYTDYINTSISIFGDLSAIEKCKNGDSDRNISAVEFRNSIAYNNGWSESLDNNIEFMKKIDEIYNPNSLFERACNFYTITKQRRDLVCDNNAKLEIIKNICLENKDKKILIISKRGEYAAKVTKYLNENLDIKRCGDYHDCIEDNIATDEYGNTIFVKSGANKGKIKIIGSQAQSTLNEKRFNLQLINILSIKSSSNVKLKIACDLVIFTSPLCDNIIDVKKRFTNIEFDNFNIVTYRIYCNDTMEQNKFIKEKEFTNIKIINDTENFIEYDENSGNIIL